MFVADAEYCGGLLILEDVPHLHTVELIRVQLQEAGVSIYSTPDFILHVLNKLGSCDADVYAVVSALLTFGFFALAPQKTNSFGSLGHFLSKLLK